MGVVYELAYHDPSRESFRLDVEVEGMTIRVKKGSFVTGGKSYSLSEDSEYDVTGSATHKVSINGYIVLDRAKKPQVLIDELVHDGVDQPYLFKDGQFTPLHPIFSIHKMAAGTKDLSGVAVKVYRDEPKQNVGVINGESN
jgi:hypothetical protein